jgi:hypothetical protein
MVASCVGVAEKLRATNAYTAGSTTSSARSKTMAKLRHTLVQRRARRRCEENLVLRDNACNCL